MVAPGDLAEASGSMFRLITTAPRARELTGALDLQNQYGLREQYETFCKKSLPSPIAETRYLLNVVGGIEIRKGEDMELGQLLQSHDAKMFSVLTQPFDLDVLRSAFTLRDSGSISLAEADQGLPTVSGKLNEDSKEKDKKHKKHKRHKDQRDHHKDKDKERHKDRDKKDKEKEREKDHNKKPVNGEDHSKKHHKKKRKLDGDEEEVEAHRHKKKKEALASFRKAGLEEKIYLQHCKISWSCR